MRLPVDWLNERVPNNLQVKELADVLTNVGLEVEAIEGEAAAPVLNITVTPNRGDCLSLVGVARELAAALRRPLAAPEPVSCPAETGPPASALASIVLADPALCPRYSARIVRQVKIAPSPPWAQRRLELCGLRPINNVVDATNLVMLELGQPLHAFDYRLLRAAPGASTPTIIVRLAEAGERLVTIDGEERALTPQVLLITDPSGPIALAGIMGGSSTEIHDGTTEVLLESAHFDPRTIRRGARSLQMSTEASYRFERVVDPGGTIPALDRACELIAEFNQGPVEIAQGVVDAYPNPIPEAEIALRPERSNALLGLNLTPDEIASHLRRLGLDVRSTGSQPPAAPGRAGPRPAQLLVRVPTFRQDLKQEIDLIEEVARAHDYVNLPETLPKAPSGVGRLPAHLALERELRALLRGLGLSEAVTSSLESPEARARLGLPSNHPLASSVVLSNAKTVDRSQLRTTLLTSLLDVLSHNRRHGVPDASLFDLGRVYLNRGPSELPDQPQHLGLAGTGVMARGRWAAKEGAARWDFYALKGVVEAVIQAVALTPGDYAPCSHPALRPGRAAQVSLGEDMIGYFGEVTDKVGDAYDLPDAVYVAELDLELLRKHAAAPHYQPVSRFPAVTRDVAFLVSRELAAHRAEMLIRETAGPELESLVLFDAYEGAPLPPGQRNLAFSLTFRHPTRTLPDAEVEEAMDRVRARLRAELGAAIRE